jgi:hypothetical protein
VKRRFSAILAGVALVGILAVGIVGAAGVGQFVVNMAGDGSQQGQATITGACQNGDPVTVTFVNEYDQASQTFVTSAFDLAGINANCTGGLLVVNGDNVAATIPTPVAGEATVTIVPTPYVIGDIETINILLNE